MTNETSDEIEYCLDPRSCPLQGACHRNIERVEHKPAVVVYTPFTWSPAIGCTGFLSADLTGPKIFNRDRRYLA